MISKINALCYEIKIGDCLEGLRTPEVQGEPEKPVWHQRNLFGN